MLRYAIIVASLAASALAGSKYPSVTAKNATDYGCKGPNTDKDIFLSLNENEDGQFDCLKYKPDKDANIFVTFGYFPMYSIDVFSDDNCKTYAAPTILPPKSVQDTFSSGESTKCVLMETAGWADWQSVRIKEFLGYAPPSIED